MYSPPPFPVAPVALLYWTTLGPSVPPTVPEMKKPPPTLAVLVTTVLPVMVGATVPAPST